MLIVVIVLGILAAIIIPQITGLTDDAKLKTLQTNLNRIRKAIDHYYIDHNQTTYPGHEAPPIKPADVISRRKTFNAQLVRYTDVNHNISDTKTAVFKFWPYIKGGKLPLNPYNYKK
jgi:general secretion pathway protein G